MDLFAKIGQSRAYLIFVAWLANYQPRGKRSLSLSFRSNNLRRIDSLLKVDSSSIGYLPNLTNRPHALRPQEKRCKLRESLAFPYIWVFLDSSYC